MEEMGAKIQFKETLPFFFQFNPKRLSPNRQNGILIYFICSVIGRPDLSKATDDEFNEIKFIGKEEFFRLSKENKIMGFDSWYIPVIMRKLKLW